MSVFGALNRFISRLDHAPQPKSTGAEGSFGFQVLRNKSSDVPLEPWFDFIVGINGRMIEDPDPSLFANEVRNCSGMSVALSIWNAKGQRLRDTYVSVPSPSPTLGLTLQWAALSSTAAVWHILEVAPNSPADEAGLLPYGDYIIGTPEGTLRGDAALAELVDEHLGRPLRLYVYNHEYDVVRSLTITPSRHWGGEGALGCVLGFGHLHQIPAPLEEGPPTQVGETMFESAKLGASASSAATAAAAIPAAAAVAGNTTFPPPGRSTPPPPAQSAEGDLSDFAMSPPKTDFGSQGSAANFVTPATMQATTAPAPTPPPMFSMTGPPPSSTGGGGGGAGTAAARHGRKARANAAGRGFDEMFAEGEKKSAAVDNAPKGKGAGLPPPPKAKSPAPGGGLDTPSGIRPETRSPLSMSGDSDTT